MTRDLERIADGIEVIADVAKSFAKSEEAERAGMLESIAKKLDQLDRAER